MINTILSDLSRVILNPKDKNYNGSLNGLYKDLLQKNTSFNFYDYFEFNEDILKFYKSLKDKYSINLFTTSTIQNSTEVKERIDQIFDNIFSAEDYGLDKAKSNAYQFIADKLKISPDKILYIDDQLENIEAARKAGLVVFYYEDYLKLRNQIEQYLG